MYIYDPGRLGLIVYKFQYLGLASRMADRWTKYGEKYDETAHKGNSYL